MVYYRGKRLYDEIISKSPALRSLLYHVYYKNEHRQEPCPPPPPPPPPFQPIVNISNSLNSKTYIQLEA